MAEVIFKVTFFTTFFCPSNTRWSFENELESYNMFLYQKIVVFEKNAKKGKNQTDQPLGVMLIDRSLIFFAFHRNRSNLEQRTIFMTHGKS